MKKNLFYLFIALFAVAFMTACGDDDDEIGKSGIYRNSEWTRIY